MHAVFFYPLVALGAAAAIAASFNYALIPPEPAAQTMRQMKTAQGAVVQVFTAEQLAHIDPGPDQYLHAMRDWRDIVAVQLATKRTSGEPNPAVQGARLLLSPETARALSGKPLIVTLRVRPLAPNTTPHLSLSAQGEAGPAEWITQPVPVAEARLTFTLPATANPHAIGFWPHPQADEYYDYYGIEILDARVESAS